MPLRQLALVLALTGLAWVQAAPTDLVVHEQRSDMPLQLWTRVEPADPAAQVAVRIALTQQNFELGDAKLMDISTPSSPNYGKHLTADEVNELFMPSFESVEEVAAWLMSSGIGVDRLSLSYNRQRFKFNASIAELERLVHARYYVWQHKSTKDLGIATERYHVPSRIHKHIDYITPGIGLHSRRLTKTRPEIVDDSSEAQASHHKKRPAGLKHCAHRVTPQCIAHMYGISNPSTPAQPGNSIGFFEGGGDIYNQADFDKFNEEYHTQVRLLLACGIPAGFEPNFIALPGASLRYNGRDSESVLDAEVAMPIAYPQNFTIWQSQWSLAGSFVDPFDTWLDAIDGGSCHPKTTYPFNISRGLDWKASELCDRYEPTTVISISYGNDEYSRPISAMVRQCFEYMKLGLRGISVFASSGDDGTGPLHTSWGEYGTASPLPTCRNSPAFAALFPASCPYVTSVGGTILPPGADVDDHRAEMAWYYSGGGFSDIFPAREWQHDAVRHYVKHHLPHHKSAKSINRNGRAYPDVSAVASNISVVSHDYNGEDRVQDGTSASAPLWAAIITRINSERLAKGKSTLGFVNPALYANPDMMHDIVHGHNFGCTKKHIGFKAKKG